MKIKKDDKIQVIRGKDKGRQAQVKKTFPKKDKILVAGINLVKKHIKATRDKPGGIVDKEVPLHISKVALVCPSCKKTTRVSYTFDKTSTKKVRICQKCKSLIDKKVKKNK